MLDVAILMAISHSSILDDEAVLLGRTLPNVLLV